MGSFGGTVPHTREPRMYGSVSHKHLRQSLKKHGLRLSDYEGPAGFSTVLLSQAPAKNIEMMSLVAEIPGYLEGPNPRCIEAVTRRLAALLNQPVDMESMRRASDEWELHVTEAVEKDSELAETVHKLEEQYDTELIDGTDTTP
jgi:proteasome assembly chaperone (PAC2) family protein